MTLRVAGTVRRLPAVNASEVTLESIAIAPDAAVAILRVSAANGHWVGLLGGRTGSDLLLFERDDPTGDAGERRQRVVMVTDQPATLRTGVAYETLTLCGGPPWLFDEQQIDPSTLRLARRAPQVPPAQAALVSTIGAGGDSTPRLDALAPVAVSLRDPDTGLPRVPRALLEPAPSTGLTVARPTAVQLRWEGAPLAIARLALEVVSRQPQALSLWWRDSAGITRKAEISVGVGTFPVTLTPETPIAGRCMALYAQGSGAADTIALRGLRAYTALDGPDGTAQLISWLVQDGAQAGEASSLLARLGPEAAEQLAAHWSALSSTGKRRALKILGRHLDRPAAANVVAAAARSDDALMRDAAIAALAREDAGRRVLHELAREATPAGDAAAAALAKQPDQAHTLLSILRAPDAADRPAVRAAIARAMRRDAARFAIASAAFLADKPPPSASAALALAAAEAGQPRLVAAIASVHAPIAERFEDRYRFAIALRHAETTAETTRWLEREAREAPEWMQRRAALEALSLRDAGRAAALAEGLARDATPRVRASAASVLIDAGQRTQVEALAAGDPWPLVRRAAIEALARDAASLPALIRALDDAAPSVRRAAIEALRAQRATTAWPRVRVHLEAAAETAEVRHAAIAFARALCIDDAQATLHALAARLTEPAASEPEAALAVDALRALAALGGSARAQGAALVERANVRALTALWSQLPRAACRAPDK